MMEIPYLELEPYMRAVTTVLIHSLWQGGLIAIFAAVALSLMRGGSAVVRYTISCCAVAAIIVAVGVTAVAVWPDRDGQAALVSAPADGPAVEQGSAVAGEARVSAESTGEAASSPSRWWQNPLINRYIFMAWAAGVIILSVYHLIGWRRARQFTKRGTSPVPPEWQARFGKLRDELKVRRLVSLLASSRVTVPCVIGWMKPVILVPLGLFTSLDPSVIEMILAHELAHVRRYDILVNILQTAMETLFFFNPAVWWLSRQIRIEREDCCDDTAILKTGNRFMYARALADLEEMRMFRTSFSSAMASTPLGRRIQRIAGSPRPRFYSSTLSLSGLLLIASITVVLLGSPGGWNESAVQARESIEETRAFDPGPDDFTGEWEIESHRDELRILVYGRQSSGMYYTLDRKEAKRLTNQGKSSFQIVRDAGTLFLEGKLEERGRRVEGSGRWYFQPDTGYMRFMERYGLREDDIQKTFSLAIFDVSREYLAGMEECGLSSLNVDLLISARNFGISPELVEEFRAAGYPDLSYNKLLSMRVQRVTPEEAREFERVGLGHLTADQLISARINGVTPEFVERFRKAGFHDLKFQNFSTLKAFGINVGEFKDCWRHRFMDLSEENMVWVCGFGITEEEIMEMKERGFTDIDAIIKQLAIEKGS
jgi:beta-lactamase regulating signal transducer with metallopeptidase domain